MWQNYSGNVDADKIFAFVRYTDAHKLIIIVNFDFDNAHSFSLKFGEHAFDTIGIPKTGTIHVVDVFETSFDQSFSVEQILAEGMPVELAPNSALILEVQ